MNQDMIDKLVNQLHENAPIGNKEHEEVLELLKTGQSPTVVEQLVAVKPRDTGGGFALAGFYYQFLVSLEYFIEMLNGKWDFIALELHEDIVCGSANLLRFIQVKSSHEPDVKVDQLVKRTEVKQKNKRVELNDSWLDKLLRKDASFDEFNVQYELVTSFPVTSVGPLSVKDFVRNDKFQCEVKDTNAMFRKLNRSCFERGDGKLQPFHHPHLKECLQHFKVTQKLPFAHLEDYEQKIIGRLTDVVCKLGNMESRVGRLIERDMYELLGKFMNRCARVEDSRLVLVITATDALQIANELLDGIRQAVDSDYDKHGDISVINEIFRGISKTLDQTPIGSLQSVKDLTDEYYYYLVNWLREEGTLRSVIGRYKEGARNSRLAIELTNTQRHDILRGLIRVSLLFGIQHGGISEFDDEHEFLLVKKIPGKYSTCYVHLDDRERFEDGVKKLEAFVEKSQKSQLMLLVKSKPKALIQGNYSGYYHPKVSTIMIHSVEPELVKFGDNQSVAKVTNSLKVYSGFLFGEAFTGIHEHLTLGALRQKLDEAWAECEVTN